MMFAALCSTSQNVVIGGEVRCDWRRVAAGCERWDQRERRWFGSERDGEGHHEAAVLQQYFGASVANGDSDLLRVGSELFTKSVDC